MFPKTIVNERKEIEIERRRTRPLLKYGDYFYCRYKEGCRGREECKLNMASRLNQTKRGARELPRQVAQGKRTGIAKMAGLYGELPWQIAAQPRWDTPAKLCNSYAPRNAGRSWHQAYFDTSRPFE